MNSDAEIIAIPITEENFQKNPVTAVEITFDNTFEKYVEVACVKLITIYYSTVLCDNRLRVYLTDEQWYNAMYPILDLFCEENYLLPWEIRIRNSIPNTFGLADYAIRFKPKKDFMKGLPEERCGGVAVIIGLVLCYPLVVLYILYVQLGIEICVNIFTTTFAYLIVGLAHISVFLLRMMLQYESCDPGFIQFLNFYLTPLNPTMQEVLMNYLNSEVATNKVMTALECMGIRNLRIELKDCELETDASDMDTRLQRAWVFSAKIY
jgi:hypothetical protein